MHTGAAIVQTLERLGVTRAYHVPGESFLAVLDGLYDSDIETITCRHEAGATYAAEAHGKATGRAGVALVTRGPGAANAKIGVYTAWQDETPLVLFIGLIPTSDRYRDSFQEFDPVGWFGGITKGVFVVDDPQRASRIVANAFHLAESGRRGPVVVGLPEDLIEMPFEGQLAHPIAPARGAVSPADIATVEEALRDASRPLLVAGAQGWTQRACDAVRDFAETNQIPVLGEFRASDRIHFDSPANAGWLGTARSDHSAHLLDTADVVVCLGAKLSDKPTDNFTLRQDPGARTIVVSADSELKGHVSSVTHHVLADPAVFATTLGDIDLTGAPDTTEWYTTARAHHQEFSTPAPFDDLEDGAVDVNRVMQAITQRLPDNALCTFGAGSHCAWPQRYFPTRAYPSMLATRLGAMGYSVPAALAAKLALPERTVVAFTGDGELLMNGQELVTAVRYNAPMLVILLDNSQYGTIREHQEDMYPGRVSGTQLDNPDFSAWARSLGAWAETLDTAAEVDAVVGRAFDALAHGHVALVHVVVDQEHASPN
ncbi:thiamine pyrophosphate-dependent enzyme [Corynebacterium timonense]|uniref:acetolactate synthase n=1 Tax=Corynebacterium timonense TaxID=441500 RepID=A0A1H1R139_9CORY|nr:thiamine pyrophosphate-dependent enzyme [Corynebacterium timonense]SDS29468.1 acetolactate synthase-1/2/3 large subunit [Corynebacterium timonense]